MKIATYAHDIIDARCAADERLAFEPASVAGVYTSTSVEGSFVNVVFRTGISLTVRMPSALEARELFTLTLAAMREHAEDKIRRRKPVNPSSTAFDPQPDPLPPLSKMPRRYPGAR